MEIHVLMRDEKEGRKKQARSNKQQGKAIQHSTPKAVTFPKKNELPRVGLEPTTCIYIYMYILIVVLGSQCKPTMVRMRWKFFPWYWNACSNVTLSSILHCSVRVCMCV